MKSVAVKHPKTASDFLKPIEQSNIITHDLETVKKQTFLTQNQLLQNIKKPLTNYQDS